MTVQELISKLQLASPSAEVRIEGGKDYGWGLRDVVVEGPGDFGPGRKWLVVLR